MICDDSPTVRSAIARILQTEPSIEIVSRVPNGQAAIDEIGRRPIEIVVLDIEMPTMDGMTALPQMLRADPNLRIIMASTLTTRGADIAMQALRLGAADYIPKPSTASIADESFGRELIAKVTGLARLRRRRSATASLEPRHLTGSAADASGTSTAARGITLRSAPARVPLLLAIGSSTGGPQALFTLVESLGSALRLPIILTQHMPRNFTPILADHLTRLGAAPCAEAQNGEMLRPGFIHLAPGDRHLMVERVAGGFRARLSDTPAENFCRPSVDPMLRSAAAATMGRTLVVMLTGMGHDGLAGTREIVNAGGGAIAQDEETSVVWGMPGAIAQAGLCHRVLPLPRIGPAILELLKEWRA
jgi:two-component system chemotaxis response regulator CheB